MSDIAQYQTVSQHNSDNHLIIQYIHLVKPIAQHLLSRLPQSIQLNDLMQIGLIGLMEAAKNFDPTKNSHFSAYAKLRIRGAMLDEIRKSNWIPRTAYENSRKIAVAIQHVEQQQGRSAKAEEIAAALDISLEAYHDMLNNSGHTQLLSFEQETLDNTIAGDTQPTPFDHLEDHQQKQLVGSALRTLPEKEKLVLSLYYTEELTLKEIGQVLQVSESRISQIHSQAISRLRARLAQAKEGQNGT